MTNRTRLLSLTLTLAAALPLAACKKEKAKEQPAAEEAKTGGETPTEPTPSPTEPPPPSAPQVVKVDGFQTPESVLYDEAAGVYLVSNINGTPFDKDDNGFIAKVSPPPDGKIVEPAWIDGKNEKVTLNAPKGMAVLGGVLYVADIDVVRMFDMKTGEPKGEVKLKGATFLNDVAAGKDAVYVSDTGLDKEFKPGPSQSIWEIKGGKGKQIAKGADLGGPNGILVQGDEVWVVSFGAGELYKIGKGGKKEAAEKLPKGQLDGIVAGPDGTLYITSWEASAVFHGKPGNWTMGPLDVKSPADLAIDAKRNLLIIPLFQENRIEMHEVPRGAGGAPAPAGEAGAAAPAPAPAAGEDTGKDTGKAPK
jgi:sugar lactone lactonase YvrE